MAEELTDQDWQVRLFVYRYFVEYGRPPTTFAASDMFGLTEPEMQEIYQRLHDGHAFFLEPGTFNVRMANPLSAIETPYRVNLHERRPLYANCAWDSVGIPAMLHADADIDSVYTSAEGDQPAHYAIKDGELTGDDGLVHFPLPFRHWYDDLIHTWATMMLFRSEEEIDRWCAATGEPRGEAIPLGTVWDLSKVWYANRMSPDFRGRTIDEVMAVFQQCGLTSDFWRMEQ